MSKATATVISKTNRPYYMAVLRFKDESGNWKTKTITSDIPVKGDNKRKAEEWKNDILAKHLQEHVNLSKDAYFVDYIIDWLDGRLKKNKIQPTTYDGYKMILDSHILPYFTSRRLKVRQIEPNIIKSYVNKKLETLSGNSVRQHIAVLSGCLKSAVKLNMIAYNPVSRIDKPSAEQFEGAIHLKEDEIPKVLSFFENNPLEIVVLLTLFYGLRRSEAYVKNRLNKDIIL